MRINALPMAKSYLYTTCILIAGMTNEDISGYHSLHTLLLLTSFQFYTGFDLINWLKHLNSPPIFITYPLLHPPPTRIPIALSHLHIEWLPWHDAPPETIHSDI